MTDLIQVSNMDPHLMLLVFLPILLFESAFAVDMGVLRKQMSQIWCMALVGVLISSLLTACFVWALRPDWEFNVCWLVGTITSATDPVAVVALLKELGTNKAIGTLIEGESLLNDGRYTASRTRSRPQ
jgi:sodium/hydrogen exchanger 10/11